MTFGYRHRKIIIFSGILLILLSIGFYVLYQSFSNQKQSTEKEKISLVKKKKEETPSQEDFYKVDIKGEVAFPGMYSLSSTSRILDVIEKAGGLTENADISVINLSKKIQDEMVIIIYSKEEVSNFEKTKEKEKSIQESCIQKEENSLKNDACITNHQIQDKISINTATIQELMTLTGIGESKAKDIITYREKNGPFQKIEDIMNISGIGESLFAKIKEDITV